MTPTLVASEELDGVAGDDTGTGELGARKDDVDSIVRLKATLAALAHVHGILVRLRDRAGRGAATSKGEK